MLGIAEVEVIRCGSVRQRVDRPRQHGDLRGRVFVLVVAALELRDETDGLARRWAHHDRLADVEGVPLELGARGQTPDVARNGQCQTDRRP